MWSIKKQKNIEPDFNVANNIIKRLNAEFDPLDYYHHSHSLEEMFEFKYTINNHRSEAWEIRFMNFCVANGGGGEWGLDYEDSYEEDYIFLKKENEEKIYNIAKNNAIQTISQILKYVSFSDIDENEKNNWINIINEGKKQRSDEKNGM